MEQDRRERETMTRTQQNKGLEIIARLVQRNIDNGSTPEQAIEQAAARLEQEHPGFVGKLMVDIVANS